MGAACCKMLDPESPRSPHLPFCEVVRRCARVVCPVDPPQQKPLYRSRKYGLTDIVGPVVKKDSWAQTDPQPPPRFRRGREQKRRKGERRRSRSVEFLPYLIRREDAVLKSSTSAGSLEDIAGQEDVLDFQMFFMSRLPTDSTDEGKAVITDKKKEFLSGLLGEENNNLILGPPLSTTTTDLVKEETLQRSSNETRLTTTPLEVTTTGDSLLSSRRSSITESLREFESSLLEMLDEEEPSSLTATKDLAGHEEEEEEEVVKMMVPVKKKDLPPLREEKEEEYVISPLEEEDGQTKTVFIPEQVSTSKEDNDKENNIDDNSSKNKNLENFDNNTERKSKPTFNDQPPTIKIEIVS